WVNSVKEGASFDQIAANFYQAALAYPAQTGYSANMSNEDFVRIIYKNVLGRTGQTAPSDSEVKYWADDIGKGSSRSNLINTMLFSARTFARDKEWGWVTTLLNNKVALAKYFAIEQGLNYNTPEDSISNTVKMIDLVTPTDLVVAKKTLALSETQLNLSLSSGSGQGRMLDCFNPDLYVVGTHIQTETKSTIDEMPDRTVTDDYRVSGPVDFFGSTVLELKGSRGDVSAISNSTKPINWYVGVGKDEYLDFGDGNTVQYNAQANVIATITYNTPARRLPFFLKAYEKFTQTFAQPQVDATSRTLVSKGARTEIVQFFGVEDMEVPAGKFKACKIKFTLVGTSTFSDRVYYSWFVAEGPYRGMKVRDQSEGDWANYVLKLSIQ
ncbi:MAG: DUF4214 domain-containing protein, partial [Burkholderiales bacterium]|nr:DUF4214 domain-containing protein [Burkholderiales bacterium]